VIALAGLESAARRKAGGYSLGMRQRLGIAAALLGDPPVLIFDEPFNGMNPEGIVWMKGFLRSLAAQDRAVLVSSHLMSELEALLMERGAGHVVIIGRGRVIADTSVADLSLSSERVVAILTEHAVVFTEITAHRATLEEAYMELTRESVEFRAEATS
jgi:ABC-2 type transport system ATP-binding protein